MTHYPHPWLDRFLKHPDTAFNEFIKGYANLGNLNRLDKAHIAVIFFKNISKEDSIWAVLESTILDWLRDARDIDPHDIDQPQLQRFIREIVDVFDIIMSLDMYGVYTKLKGMSSDWENWTKGLILSPARDAHASYQEMLHYFSRAK